MPAEVSNLTNLRTLELSDNNLSSIPAEIWIPSSLETLNLGSNQLVELPAEISSLGNLQVLMLQYNQLSSLPGSIGNLSNLCLLDIRENNFERIPFELHSLRLGTGDSCVYYTGLYLDDYLFEDLPAEVQQDGIEAIQDYLEHQVLWQNLQRLIIIGASGSGFLIFATLILRLRSQQPGKRKKKPSAI